MAQQGPPARTPTAEPTLSWAEILKRLLELDERLKALEEKGRHGTDHSHF